ncbi:ABC transporter ATP-binding protein [Streptococcus mutans]|uniref:ABC transporter ATP-binding protein n=2 Tax=Streptococcus mutans TaxID=1309 RepID=UPI00034D8ACA|nr:ATP-binding cassette domain-containing protein [Streptococcus mutans]MCB4949699.1 ATP-binding cassette domain-containing protein [Streptococcus mutans]MCB4960829.1 ATP-binding cassette domain-containing protein [Streptococcus mutans]MCB5000760.1 ATP-binding cassette domain-containing protein [Streptococcus mutans]MCB5078486.1 ATP-binding cassette domain-containing protein [Streptococcus mutans]MCB5128074.1 ATP-binding cassette domain-containing protein [Streptococcus mutans]
MKKKMMELNQVKKVFGEQTAVDLNNLKIEQGEIYGLIGPNGAGKSTIMKMICGLLTPTAGQINVAGSAMKENNRIAILKQIGSLIEEPAYYDNLTGYENLQILKELKNLTDQDVAEVLTIVHLTENKDKQVKYYSLRMKQRLGIAMAIMGHPKLIILDEPTNGLDPQAREEIRKLIRILPATFNTTVMISSHALDEIEKMVTLIGIIGKGKLLYQGTVEQFKSQYSRSICLRTSDDMLAVSLLDLAPNDVKATDQGLLLSYLSDEQVALTVKRLLEADVAIYRIYEVTKSLEELFIDFTAEDAL